MRYRQLGTGLRVSVLGLGGNTFGPPRLGEAEAVRVIHAALDAGVNFIDTALVYGGGESETFIGRALHGRRDDAVIATKFNFRGLDGEKPAWRIRRHLEESLRKLQTDRIDLFQVHGPSDVIGTAELAEVFARLRAEGKIREYGVSNYASWRLAETVALADALGVPRPASVQNQYNLLHRRTEQELVPACARYEIPLIPFHPLAGGFLTGKYRPGEPPPPGSRGAAGSPIVRAASTERNWKIVLELGKFAAEHDRTLSDLAIAWLIANPTVSSVITGVSNTGQLEDNLRGAEWELNSAEIDEVNAITWSPEQTSPEDYMGQFRPLKAG